MVLGVCPAGQTEQAEGSSCGCAAGRYLDARRACAPCPVAQYCPEGALPTRCPIGFTTDGRGAKSRDECGCPSGTYEIAAAGAGRSCEPCNDDMNCSRIGLTLATVPLLPSRWRHSNRTAYTYECNGPACLGGDWNGTSDGYCAYGHEGPRCEWCSDPNQFYDDEAAACTECANLAPYAFRRFGILLAIIVSVALVHFALIQSPVLLARVSKTLAVLVIIASRFGIKSKCEPHPR